MTVPTEYIIYDCAYRVHYIWLCLQSTLYMTVLYMTVPTEYIIYDCAYRVHYISQLRAQHPSI